MALGVEGMRAGKVVRKVIFLTLGTAHLHLLPHRAVRVDAGGDGRRWRVRVGWRLRDPPGVPEGRGLGDPGLDLRDDRRRDLHLPRRVRRGRPPALRVRVVGAVPRARLELPRLRLQPARPARHRVGLGDLRLRVRGHGRRAPPPPLLPQERALDALGTRPPTPRRLPPPVQAAADPRPPIGTPPRRRAHRRTSTVHSSTPYARTSVATARTRARDAARAEPASEGTLVPPPATTPPEAGGGPPPKPDVVEQLATLADLRERGMLDDDEYEKAKNAVLGEETS